jgi:hypothetical protein
MRPRLSLVALLSIATTGAGIAMASDWTHPGGDAEISATFVQPFLSYSLGKGRTFGLNTESTYDWEAGQWTVPVNVTYSRVTKIGGQLVSIGGGVRGYLDSPTGGPDWGVRLIFTLLYPK